MYTILRAILLLTVFTIVVKAALKSKASRIYVGSALAPSYLSEPDYKRIAAQEFNCMTPENEMKWDSIERTRGQANYGPADTLVSFAKQSGMKVRGHTLIWHQQVPSWLNSLSKTELESAMKKHITDVMTHFKGKIYAWDVVNEIFDESGKLRQSLWSKNFGESFVAEAFKTARATDPSAKLYINDYNVESHNAKQKGLLDLVKRLKGEGVPIDGVGLQSHFSVGQGSIKDLASVIKEFAALGVDVAITELDIKGSKQQEEAQAKDYATVFEACESVPRCVGVTVWGFTDKHTWINGDACLFDSSYKPKPAYNAVNAVLK